jgi:hypothetical protein
VAGVAAAEAAAVAAQVLGLAAGRTEVGVAAAEVAAAAAVRTGAVSAAAVVIVTHPFVAHHERTGWSQPQG